MRIRVVCYEDVETWILGKFASKLSKELSLLGQQVDIAKNPDRTADINHHIIYLDYEPMRHSINTLMVTHIDAHWKLRKLRAQLQSAAAAVCMSSDTVRSLESAGLPSNRLCYVNPAHDGIITPRPLKVGIATRLYPDGRKRERLLLGLSKHIDVSLFSFSIIGAGWDDIVGVLRESGLAVEYFPDFEPATYHDMIRSLDYYLYLGMDEGSMGFVDAVAAGVSTIVTRQGYHLDAPEGITHSFVTEEELCQVFDTITNARIAVTRSVASWTWHDYAVKHLQIWNYLKNGQVPENFRYSDGLISLLGGATPPGIPTRCATEFGYVKRSARTLFSAKSKPKSGGT